MGAATTEEANEARVLSKPSSKRRSRDDEGDLHPTQTTEWGSPGSLVVGLDCRSMNLYRFLRVRFPAARHSVLQSWIGEGRVSINGTPVTDSRPLRSGDVVEIAADVTRAPKKRRGGPEVLYEDEHLVVVNKPAGLAAAPERNPRHPDLLSWLKNRAGDDQAPKLVHRIDKHASGLVVFARTRDAKRTLIADFAGRRVRKDYLALVTGHFPDPAVLCHTRLTPGRGRRPRMQVTEHTGKECWTYLRNAWQFTGHSVVHARPVTGRTHQIRVHLRHLGHAIVGDDLYDGEAAIYLSRVKADYHMARGEKERPLLDRLALHAYRIELPHPSGSGPLTFEAPLPADLKATLRQLQKASGTRPDPEYDAWTRDPLDREGTPFAGLPEVLEGGATPPG